eukprot:scaffold63326_cov72-Cyclotella_meneghiniana.AAC.2
MSIVNRLLSVAWVSLSGSIHCSKCVGVWRGVCSPCRATRHNAPAAGHHQSIYLYLPRLGRSVSPSISLYHHSPLTCHQELVTSHQELVTTHHSPLTTLTTTR